MLRFGGLIVDRITIGNKTLVIKDLQALSLSETEIESYIDSQMADQCETTKIQLFVKVLDKSIPLLAVCKALEEIKIEEDWWKAARPELWSKDSNYNMFDLNGWFR